MSKKQYILTHGLNVPSLSMEHLADALDWPKGQCTFICLPGHGEGESLQGITAAHWLDSFSAQYQAAFQSSAPTVYLGFSLGGLLMTYLLGKQQVPAPARQILFAPALAFQAWTRLPAYLPNSPLNQLLIPSLSPSTYKATPGVSIGVYKVLFAIRQQLDDLDATHYNVPTLVLCDQHDELVRPEGLRTFIREKQLDQWQLHVFPSSRRRHWGKKHLLIAPEYQSETYWQHIRDLIDDFLNV